MNIQVKNLEVKTITTKLKSLDSKLQIEILKQDDINTMLSISEYLPIIGNIIIIAIVKNCNRFYCFNMIPEFAIEETAETSFVLQDDDNYFQYSYEQTKEFLKLQNFEVLQLGEYLLELQTKFGHLNTSCSEWFGEIDHRYILNLKVIEKISKKSNFGIYFEYILSDNDNNNFSWRTRDYNLHLYNIYNIKARIKSHELQNNIKLTILSNGNLND